MALAGIAFLFYLLAMPFFGDSLIHSLEVQYQPPLEMSGDVIVMLGGGATLDTPNPSGRGNVSGDAANRLLTCLQLYHQLKVPIVLSGGQVFRTTGPEAEIAKATLLGIGVPSAKLIVENQSRNTTENAKFTKKILDQLGFHRPVLVTSAFHMPRAVNEFTRAGVAVLPYPTGYRVNTRQEFEFRKLIPTAEALENTSLALKEYLGLFTRRKF